jgi:uncharacterized protein
MREEIRALLEIQNLDMEIRELKARSGVIEDGLESILSEIEKDERIIKEEKDKDTSSRVRSKELELEVEEKKNRIDKYQSQLFKIKNNKEYTALLHEIEGLKADIRILEDRILELMEEGEGEKDLMQEAQANLERARQRYWDEEEKAGEELGRIASLIREKQRVRLEKAEKIDPDLKERYEIIFVRKPDRAVAAVRHGVCTGCNMELTAQVLNDLARDEMICQCENCGRFIFLPEEDVTS